MAFDTNRLSDIESDAGSETSEDKGVGGDAQTLASLLQQQIDVINKELRWVVIVLLLLALKAQILTMFAGAGDFPWLLWMCPPATFKGK